MQSLDEIGQGNLAKDLLISCNETIKRKHAIPYQLPTNLDITQFIQKLSEQSPHDYINLCSEPLEVCVKQSQIFNEDLLDKKYPVYKMQSKNRGQVLIINNIDFKTEEFRTGAESDGINLNRLFKQIGMDVVYHCNKAVDVSFLQLTTDCFQCLILIIGNEKHYR